MQQLKFLSSLVHDIDKALARDIYEIENSIAHRAKLQSFIEAAHKNVYNVILDYCLKNNLKNLAYIRGLDGEIKTIAKGRGFKEADPKYADNIWYIDPISDYKNFQNNNPFFCITIAKLDRHGNTKLGLVYNPVLKHAYFGLNDEESGNGSYYTNLHHHDMNGSKCKKISTPPVLATDNLSVVINKPALSRYVKSSIYPFSSMHTTNCPAYDLCLVAIGSLDSAIVDNLSPFEYLAAELILQKAGCFVEKNIQDPQTLTANLKASPKDFAETLQKTNPTKSNK